MDVDLGKIETHERVIATFSIAIVVVVAAGDVAFDLFEGVRAQHLLVESLVVTSGVIALLALWWRTVSKFSKRSIFLSSEVNKARSDLAVWKTRAQTLLAGLGKAIQEQFGDWRLTEAEQEVGLMLLKGLSIKEIASIRSTSEKTVRHQAEAIYRKARVQGRNELSAFFLEDLLLPLEQRSELLKVEAQ